MAYYETLLKATQAERNELIAIPFLQAGAAGRIGLESYLAFLTQAYHHVKHTIPLLMACGGRLPERLNWLRTAVGEYIEEEMDHEEWILNDIRACGGDAEAVRNGRPALPTELMVAYAYHIIDRGNPVGFFGMVQVLEGTSIELATRAADNLQKSLGLPDSAFTYLRSHGQLDLEHVDFFRELMDKIEAPDDQQAITHCAKAMYRLYGDVFRSLPMHNSTDKENAHAAV